MSNPHIFRAYDIRGIYGKDLDENDTKLIGKAFASLIKPRKVVVGMDNRLSSPALKDALIKGLAESGVDVIDIGMVTTPMLYFAIIHFNADGGIEITGSHLGKNYNGFKPCQAGAAALFGDDIQELRKIIEKNRFLATKAKGKAEKKSIEDAYKNEIMKMAKISRRMKVAIDTGNGTAGPVFGKILDALGVEAEFIFKEPDGNYPNHDPDPSVESNLEELRKKVKEGKFDLGIAIDGDADRAFFIDENSNKVKSDHAIALLARDVLKKKKGAKIFTEVRGSMLIRDVVSAYGGIFVMGRIGHSLIKNAMRTKK
jgi:phosphomannomutase